MLKYVEYFIKMRRGEGVGSKGNSCLYIFILGRSHIQELLICFLYYLYHVFYRAMNIHFSKLFRFSRFVARSRDFLTVRPIEVPLE